MTDVALTESVVMALVQEPNQWETLRSANARNQTAAIKDVVSDMDPADQAGTYVAVPARSWAPVKIRPRVAFDVEAATP